MRLYGGFLGGKLDWNELDDGWGGSNWRKVPALFRTRQEARCQYEDVRHVEIEVINKPRKARRR